MSRRTLLWPLLAASLLAALVPAWPVAAAPAADAASAQVVVDQPRGGTSGTLLTVSGWAADPASSSGTGIERVEVYLDGERDGGGTFLGRATYGLQRPDVAANLRGARFSLSGFSLQSTVTPGPHTVDGEIAGGAPTTAAVLVGPGAGVAGVPSEIPIWTQAPTSVTARIPGVAGSYTFDAFNAGALYPPGPADTGGPVYAPSYYGYGQYGPVLPFPDVPS